jgi:hypothetical protein
MDKVNSMAGNIFSMAGNISIKQLLVGGVALYGAWYFFGDKLGFNTEDKKETIVKNIQSLVNKITGLPTPSDKEQAQIEMSGFTVDTIPQAYTLSSESIPTITAQSPFNYEVKASDVQNDTIGQESIGQMGAQIKSLNIQGFDPCCSPTLMTLPTIDLPLSTGLSGGHGGADLTMVQGKTNSDVLDPSVNSDYTNGMRTMSLAQWRSEGMVDRISETSVRYFPGDGSPDCMLRRV